MDFNFSNYTTVADVQWALDGITGLTNGTTETHKAMNLLRSDLMNASKPNGWRYFSVPTRVLILTDGSATSAGATETAIRRSRTPILWSGFQLALGTTM
jgi:hypothetical protein